jgi:tetratricopeptide (TPR) repeat protein
MRHGQDPSQTLAKAIAYAQKAIAINPSVSYNRDVLSWAYQLRATHKARLGEDVRDDLDKLAETVRATLSIDPGEHEALHRMAVASWLKCRLALDGGKDPGPFLREGREWLGRAMSSNPEDLQPYLTEARLLLVDAAWRSSRGVDPSAALAGAQRAVARALRIDPHDPRCHVLAAETSLALFRSRGLRVHSSRRDLAEGLAAAGEALAVDPTEARALAVRGALYLEQAQADVVQRGPLLAKARESLEQAIASNRFLSREYGALLERTRSARPEKRGSMPR